eukprot:scaffold1130_cov195-Pinguiococcus_pyrenoidosus.AAC.30
MLTYLLEKPEHKHVAAEARTLRESVARSGVQLLEFVALLAILWAAEYDRVSAENSESAIRRRETVLQAVMFHLPAEFRASLTRQLETDEGFLVHTLTGPFLPVLTGAGLEPATIRRSVRSVLGDAHRRER